MKTVTKSSKAQKPLSASGLMRPWPIAREALRDFAANWRAYTLIIGLVIVPINLLSISSAVSTNTAFGAYASIVTIFMSIAIISAVATLLGGGKLDTLRHQYYQASAAFIRFVLVGLALTAMLIPLALGLLVFAIVAAPQVGNIQFLDVTVVGLVALLLAIPTAALLPRYIFSLYAVVVDNHEPMSALNYSRNLVRGRFWPVLGRAGFIFLILVAGSVLAAIPATLVEIFFHNIVVFTAIYDTLASLVLMPILHSYMLRMYRALQTLQAGK